MWKVIESRKTAPKRWGCANRYHIHTSKKTTKYEVTNRSRIVTVSVFTSVQRQSKDTGALQSQYTLPTEKPNQTVVLFGKSQGKRKLLSVTSSLGKYIPDTPRDELYYYSRVWWYLRLALDWCSRNAEWKSEPYVLYAVETDSLFLLKRTLYIKTSERLAVRFLWERANVCVCVRAMHVRLPNELFNGVRGAHSTENRLFDRNHKG